MHQNYQNRWTYNEVTIACKVARFLRQSVVMNVLLQRVNAMVSIDVCVTCNSGGVLSYEVPGHNALSVPRSGQQHDERRLRFLLTAAAAQASAETAVEEGRSESG